MSLQIRVVVADDHDLFREGLVALIERDARIIVVGQANDGLETIRLVEELEVDVVLLDVEMQGRQRRPSWDVFDGLPPQRK